jgi:hypothetical protein
MGSTLIPWRLHGLILEQAQVLEHTAVLRGDLRSLPSGDLLLLHTLSGTRGGVPGELGPGQHGVEVEEAEEAGHMRCSRREKARAMDM